MDRNFTLIGHPLGHTLSPQIHARLFEISRRSGSYDATDILPDTLANRMTELDRLCGYNVTIPYKMEIIPFLSELDETARRCGAVNCVVNRNGKRIGYNTDCTGFLRSLEAGSLSLSGNVLLLGCGGAGMMMAAESISHGAKLTVAVRNPEKAAALTEKLGGKIKIIPIGNINGEYDLCLNSTPVGMFPNGENSPIDENAAARCGAVFDAIYNPTPTRLTKMFSDKGKKAVGGMAMLVWQAAAAHEIWGGAKYSDEEINGVISKMEALFK